MIVHFLHSIKGRNIPILAIFFGNKSNLIEINRDHIKCLHIFSVCSLPTCSALRYS